MKYPGYRLTLLAALNVGPSNGRMAFLDAWQQAEGGTARFNAWNTTLRLPGSTSYNTVGVQHYQDELQGNAATLLTIRLHAYDDLRAALRMPGLSAEEIVHRSARGLTTWGTGTAGILAVLARER